MISSRFQRSGLIAPFDEMTRRNASRTARRSMAAIALANGGNSRRSNDFGSRRNFCVNSSYARRLATLSRQINSLCATFGSRSSSSWYTRLAGHGGSAWTICRAWSTLALRWLPFPRRPAENPASTIDHSWPPLSFGTGWRLDKPAPKTFRGSRRAPRLAFQRSGGQLLKAGDADFPY